MTTTARWKSTVYVGGLAQNVTPAHLHDAFVAFGEIADISLPKPDHPSQRQPHQQTEAEAFAAGAPGPVTRKGKGGGGGGGAASKDTWSSDRDMELANHRGFAYVEFEDPDDAGEAMDNMDGAEFFGRVLRVSPAKPPKSADEGLGAKTAVWQQEGWLAKHAVDGGDRDAADSSKGFDDRPEDPMQGLEGLDVAGPRPEL